MSATSTAGPVALPHTPAAPVRLVIVAASAVTMIAAISAPTRSGPSVHAPSHERRRRLTPSPLAVVACVASSHGIRSGGTGAAGADAAGVA